MKKKALHTTQQQLLLILKQNMDDPLTIRDLQEEAGVSSPSLVFHHLQQLEKNGYIKRNPNNPRDYQIFADSPEKKVAYLNLYGLASCGPNGSVLDGNPIDRVPISTKFLSFPAFDGFLVKADGESMEPKIHNGDLVIAKKTTDADTGSTVVCVNNGEALIKKIKKEGDRIILYSLNRLFSPFTASNDFRIEGEVKGVISYQI